MNLPLMVLAGMAAGAGLALLLAAFAPSRPDLRSVLAMDRYDGSAAAMAGPAAWPERLVHAWGVDPGRVESLVRLPRQDLDIIARTPIAHAVYKLGGAAAGIVLSGVLLGCLALFGLAVPMTVSAAFALAVGGVGFFLPDIDARTKAEESRDRFQHAVHAYLVLVALERRAGSASQQALVSAARVGEGPAFERIRRALDRAQLQRRPAWEGLRRLGDQVNVPELADCADIMATSSEGTAVADTLLARARGLRTEAFNRRRGDANEASQRMVIPVALLGLCFIALMIYPVVIRLLSV